ncbi:DcuS/MalK family sensor histidine kinase [Mesobacillus zeae]|uniref:DcuS/MalK family sensor histidine kinase n=1 Tax=Mesobacillus zeae TaxID=1917180 RepID=UPI0015E7681C|nr:DcuS/MalK family sensor histidine kinase [Mesobacillus zeae]
MYNKRMKISTLIIFFVVIVVLLSLVVTDLLISQTTGEHVKKNIEEKAMIVSRMVAKSPIVIEGLEKKRNAAAIQDYAKDIQATTNVMFVVVMDMDGVRKSHPKPEMIGKHFVGGDEKEALKGNEHISTSTGTLGKSVRAFTPVYGSNQKQVGVVAVGISLESMEDTLTSRRKNILIGTVVGLLVGISGAILLARYIKKILFGFEPFMIAKLLEERDTMLQSAHEGIIAVDRASNITLVNKSAISIYHKAGLQEPAVGMKLTEYLHSSKLDHVMETAQPALDEEQYINGHSIIVNEVPLIVNEQVVGAIATFRDKSEVNQLAEQLTGVKMYAEALRAQSHEFMNRLHVILGMISMEWYDELKDFIHNIVDQNHHEIGTITGYIKDPALAGFFIGKLSYAREENVDLNIVYESVIPEPNHAEITHELITIIGNLIDNAIEAVAESPHKTVEVKLKYESQSLNLEIMDSGPGIKTEIAQEIFQKGFSTKGSNRGYGLYLVQKSVAKLGGELKISMKPAMKFHIIIPFETKEEVNDD